MIHAAGAPHGVPAPERGPMPSLAPLPQYNPLGSGGLEPLINLLAWGVSAASVAGLMIVGILMALQLNRGTPGEESDHFRGFTVVLFACVLGAGAGPLVTWFGDLGL
ncbi:hypothetical protein [Micromonospora ureilytica]|uniref:hypothetical protein n=1 Tax=Micromonospora ureilytica TaxID=709868 RepID=UPI002E140F54|nr:hypothetical protein OHB55_21980 [Micromonospora ureilytica]